MDDRIASRPIGIVVNPRSGTDVRRSVAAAGSVTVEDKANVVRRVVRGAREAGARHFMVHHDSHRIIHRATETMRDVELSWIDMDLTFTEEDTVTAVAAMRAADCAVVVVIGGDGTNRAAARAWPDLPVVPLSTGTNNTFPIMVEATVAGAACGHLATGRCRLDDVARMAKVVRVTPRGADLPDDLALVDAVAVDDPYVGSFELFDPATLRVAVVTRAEPTAVGFAGVAGLVEPVGPDDEGGLLLRFGPVADCDRVVRGPTAPGHYDDLGLAEVRRLAEDEEVVVSGPLLLAFDGERKRRLVAGEEVVLAVRRDGPRVVDVAAVMSRAAADGAYLR